MDGCQRRVTNSLQFRLSLFLSATIVMMALVAGIFSFSSAFKEANELQDDVLRQTAGLLKYQHESGAISPASSAYESDDLSPLVVQPLSEKSPAGGLDISPTLPDGIHTLNLHGATYRVVLSTQADNERIAIAQETSGRDEVARDSALRTLMPFVILVPILLLLVADLVRRMLGPITTLAREIDSRADDALHALPTMHLSDEVRPFVIAINRLMARTEQTLSTQRRFIADAAHELRTPLTALSLQAERLSHAEISAVAEERLSALRQGIARSRQLLEQMLSLARAQTTSASIPGEQQTSVRQVCCQVLEHLMPLADARQIDFGIEGNVDALALASPTDLLTLISNLADNAIRYTQIGGRVDLAILTAGQDALLLVRDTGPGIAPTERERVFDPFYRIPGSDNTGSGLGLAIVMTVARRIRAQVSIEYADEDAQRGLLVTVRLKSVKAPHQNAA